MTEIKRYVDQYPVSYMAESDSGDWVDYEDHAAIVAALQEQVRALAVSNLPKVGDGKEQEAFEIYARSRNLDLSQHPLHYLFLDGKTNQARSAWRECLVYVSSQLQAGEQP